MMLVICTFSLRNYDFRLDHLSWVLAAYLASSVGPSIIDSLSKHSTSSFPSRSTLRDQNSIDAHSRRATLSLLGLSVWLAHRIRRQPASSGAANASLPSLGRTSAKSPRKEPI